MSVPNPTTNNLTLVKFGPLSVDFTKTGTYTLGQLEYDEQTFIPTNAFVVYTNALGTNGTQAIVAIDNGTTNENVFQPLTLPATPVASSPNASANLSQSVFGFGASSSQATYNYVLGQVPVGTNGNNGAASTESLRVNVTTAAIPALATTNRVTANNISTLTVSAVPSWLVAGVQVKVQSVGNAAYNGLVTVISTTSTTFSYYNPSIVTEASTADTAGRIGALTGDVCVVGLLQ
jgi:hypothetical protein